MWLPSSEKWSEDVCIMNFLRMCRIPSLYLISVARFTVLRNLRVRYQNASTALRCGAFYSGCIESYTFAQRFSNGVVNNASRAWYKWDRCRLRRGGRWGRGAEVGSLAGAQKNKALFWRRAYFSEKISLEKVIFISGLISCRSEQKTQNCCV